MKALKRMIIGILATIGLMVLFSSIMSIIFLFTQRGDVPEQTILRIDFRQPFVEDIPESSAARAFLQQQPVMRDVVETLLKASEDDRIKGLVARISFVNMGLAQIQEIRDAVTAFRASGKPAIAYCDTFGELQSGNRAYYLATAFDEVYMQPSGTLALTGLISQTPFYRGTLDKLGIQPRLDHRKEYKNYMNIFTETEYTDAHREAVEAVVDSFLNQIARGIAESRKRTEAEARDLIAAGPYSGQQAVEAGLIDRLFYWDEVDEMLHERFGRDLSYLELRQYLNRNGRLHTSGETIALIYGVGGVQRGTSDYNPLTGDMTMGAETVASAFRSAMEDDSVKAIIFRVDSPGGSYIASDTIWRETVRAGNLDKPVIVSMGNVAGSGGYFVAASAHKIVAHPATLTGSIGVVGGKMVMRDFWNKLGVTWDSVYTSENAKAWSPLFDFTPEQWDRFQEWLDRIYDDFTDKVAQGRHMPKEEVLEIAKGRIWTGEDAKKLGLVDELGGFPEAIRLAREAAEISADASIHLKQFPERLPPLERLLQELALSAETDPALARLVRTIQPVARVLSRMGLLSDQPQVLRMADEPAM